METTFQKNGFSRREKMAEFFPITEPGTPGATLFQVANGLLTIVVQGIVSFR